MVQKLHGASDINHVVNQTRLQLGGLAATVGARVAELNDRLDLRQMPSFTQWERSALPNLRSDVRAKLEAASQQPDTPPMSGGMRSSIEKSVMALAQASYEAHGDVLRENSSSIRARLHEFFPWGVSEKTVRAFNAVRNEGNNLVDRAKGHQPSNAYSNPDPRGKIFSQMCDTSSMDSALHRVVAKNVQTVADAGVAKALSDVKQGKSPDLSMALVSDGLRGFAPDKDLRSVLDPRLALSNCPPLRKEATLSHFATSVVDQYMKPSAEVCQSHAEVVHGAVVDLRGKLQKMMDQQAGGERLNSDFSRKVEDMFSDAAQKITKQVGSRHLGLDKNQASLVGMGLQTWIADVIQTPYNAGSATSLLGMLGAAIPAGDPGAAGRIGLSVARGVVGFAVGAATQAAAGQPVAHSAAAMRGLPAGLIGSNFNALDKVVTKATRQAIEHIQSHMNSASLEAAYHENVSTASGRMSRSERWFGPLDSDNSQKAAREFLQDSAIPVHDALTKLKDNLTKQLADKAHPLPEADQAKAQSALNLLSGIRSATGIAPVGPNEVMGQIMGLMEKTGAARADTSGAALHQAIDALMPNLSGKQKMELRTQIANPMPSAPIATDVDLLHPGAIMRAVNNESPAFQKLMTDLATSFGPAGKQDAFVKAVATVIHTDLIVGIVGTALTTLMSATATAAATASPLGPVAGGLVGAAVGSGISTAVSKGVRAITGMTTDLSLAEAATRNRVADAALMPRTQVTAKQIAGSLETGWTPLNKLRDGNLEKITSRLSHDAQAKITEESARMGRNLLGSLFIAGHSSVGTALLARFDKLSAQYNVNEHKKAAAAPDLNKVEVAKGRIGQAGALAGIDSNQTLRAADSLDDLSQVRRLNQRAEKADELSTRAGNQLPGLCRELIKQIDVSAKRVDANQAMSPKEWNAISAFLQYPNGHADVRQMVQEAGQELKDLWQANGTPSGQSDLTSAVVSKLPDAKAFQRAQARHEDNINKYANDVNVLGRDLKNYQKGQYEGVQDPFGLFNRVSKGYESELRQLKVADVNSGYLEERVAGAVYGRGGLGARVAGAAFGVAPVPAASVQAPGAIAVNLTSPVQAMAQSVTTNPLAPFAESAEWLGRNPAGKARWLDTVRDVASNVVDPEAQQAVNMSATTKVRSAKKDGVLSHDSAGLGKGVVGYPSSMARQVRSEEASGAFAQRIKNFLNVPKHLNQSKDSFVANSIKPGQELTRTMASVTKIHSAAVGANPDTDSVKMPKVRTFRISDAFGK